MIDIDIYDGMAIAGLGLLGTGLWMISPEIALSVMGGILLVLGTILAREKGKRG